MLESGLTGLSPEQRYLAKKREAALTLMEKKEAMIKQGVMEKLEGY